jgi:hypothetical protein
MTSVAADSAPGASFNAETTASPIQPAANLRNILDGNTDRRTSAAPPGCKSSPSKNCSAAARSNAPAPSTSHKQAERRRKVRDDAQPALPAFAQPAEGAPED